MVTGKLCTLFEGRCEVDFSEFLFTSFTDVLFASSPHICHKDDVLQRWDSAEPLEHFGVPYGHSSEPIIGNAVNVKGPGEFGPVLIPGRAVDGRDPKLNNCTHVTAKDAAIPPKVSESLALVSSKPGVSMRDTHHPSRVNSFATWTSAVHDFRFFPTRSCEPLAILMN